MDECGGPEEAPQPPILGVPEVEGEGLVYGV